MCRTLLFKYIKADIGRPLSFCFKFLPGMDLLPIIIFLILFLTLLIGQEIPPNYNKFKSWKVIHSNSSGELYWRVGTKNPRFLAWQPKQKKNELISPTFYYGTPPAPETSTSTTVAPETSTTTSPLPVQSAQEVPKKFETQEVPKDLGDNLLSHVAKMAKLMEILNVERKAPKLIAPHRESKPFNATEASNDTIVYAGDEVSLTKESSLLYHICMRKLHARRQVTPDITTEIELSDAQLRTLKAHVNRRFLVEYDCSNPREVKPISSFVQDPCEPAEANERDTYEIDPPNQYNLIQYETRRGFKGTRCEKYISQFTYHCGAADHSSPLPQETFYRRPKIMTLTECKNLASMSQYIARDGKTYSVSKNVRKEINYFARGSATAYTGYHGSQITCTGGKLKVDESDTKHMVMYVTEEILYRAEKFISRDDEDGVIAHYDNVRLSCPIEDSHCVSGDVTYVWTVPLTNHCPLYHVRNFKGQMIKYELPGLTIKAHKVVMSTDNSHVRFVIKGNKAECGQSFLTTNHLDLLIRNMIVEGVPDRDLIT